MTSSTVRLTSLSGGIDLGPLDQIDDNRARNFVIETKDGRFIGLIYRKGDQVFGYVDQCPHALLPLAHRLDDYMTKDGDLIKCDWHGALFRTDDGHCIGGPCAGRSLIKWPVHIINGHLITGD
jgi:nitrite reductase/ring-hydroxylating ferredoxin subunit